ncbi:TspO/MBR family protein [Sphingomonas sp.]|uniref:TspO/MBR family protein n=1 Tax=Sphingomonas sp. TaxID=28214 RepID=UPI002B97B7F3|nr:TspO/MBR family protein [Sphingomonas sp.]HWK35957.1 TspO/MBR family protein [Sphingomonas sp.]
MREIASKGQLWAAFLRWAAVTVPLILLLGFASARLAPSGDQNRWFTALAKPDFMPPNAAFPIAWTLLYILLGLALALIINARGSRSRPLALGLFAVQMALNLAWSPLFFGLHRVSAAIALTGAMFVAAALTAWVFWRIRPVAGALLLPYLLWIAFAFALVWEVDRLNPGAETLVPAGDSTQILV